MADYLMLSIWKEEGGVGCNKNFTVSWRVWIRWVTTSKNKSKEHMLKVVGRQKKMWLSTFIIKLSRSLFQEVVRSEYDGIQGGLR